MKNKKIWNILSIMILALQVIAEGLTAAIILRMNLLPGKYTLVLAIALVLFAAITAVLLFVRGKKPVSSVRRLIACILALLIACGCALVSKLATDAFNTIEAVANAPQASVRNMYVLVPNESPAQSLADTKGFTFGILTDYDIEHTQQAISLIGDTIGETPVIAQYESAAALADALLGGQVDAAIMNGVSIVLLMEQEGYEEFTLKARILHTVPLADLEETAPSTQEETLSSLQNITNTPFVMYISGSDTRSEILKISRSDVNILVVVNPVTKQILMVNTPRDYYIPNPQGKGKLDKLTHCGLYGVECSIEALSDLYDLEVDYFAQINFTGFETLVDAVGGVDIYSEKAFKTAHKTEIQEGMNHLNGKEALALARERRAVKGGDNGRGKNQMKIIKNLIEKLTDGPTLISGYSKILDSLKGMFTTDVSTAEITAMVKMQLTDLATWNIQTYAVTGTGASKPSYSSPGHSAYVMIPNDASVEHGANLVDRVLAGETLTEDDLKVPK